MVLRIAKVTKRNTAGVLGRQEKFKLSDLDDMASVTSEDLEGWGVYIMFVEKFDGSIDVYVGSGTHKDGLGMRLVKTYEASFRTAAEKYFSGSLAAPFPASAVALDTKAKHMRVAASGRIPSDPTERREARDFWLMYEAFLTDYVQSLDKLSDRKTITMHKNGSMDVPAMIAFSEEAAPGFEYEMDMRGLNKMSPWRQGYRAYVHLVRRWEVLFGTTCPLCKDDMTKRVWYDHVPDGVPNNRLNPLAGVLEWLPHKVICQKCYHWVVWPSVRDKLMEMSSLEEAQARRAINESADNRGWFTSEIKLKPHEINASECCPICDDEMESRRDDEKVADARTRLGKRLASPNNLKTTFQVIAQIEAFCFDCYRNMGRALREHAKGEWKKRLVDANARMSLGDFKAAVRSFKS